MLHTLRLLQWQIKNKLTNDCRSVLVNEIASESDAELNGGNSRIYDNVKWNTTDSSFEYKSHSNINKTIQLF